MTTVYELRSHLEKILLPYLGQYKRRDDSLVPAVWVFDRPKSNDDKVIVSAVNEPLVNAIELSIEPVAQPKIIRGGHRHHLDFREYTIRLVAHDRRQFQDLQTCLDLIFVNFRYINDSNVLSGSDDIPLQALVKIALPVSICPSL